MLRGPTELVWIGFAIAAVGFFALNYMNVRIRQQNLNQQLGRPFESRYWSMVKQQVGTWPIYTAAICIPTGIILMFGAIIYSNHLKIR